MIEYLIYHEYLYFMDLHKLSSLTRWSKNKVLVKSEISKLALQ